jgi:sugar phosphate isomerase/epimerase
MPPLRIGIQVSCLNLPLKRALFTARELGAETVELDARSADLRPLANSATALRQLRKLLDDLELRVAAVSFRTRRGYDVLDDLEARVEATRQAMRLAHALGARFVINQVGHVPEPGSDDTVGYQQLVSVLRDLGVFGHHVGAMLLAETGAESAPALRKLLDALPPGTIGLDLNPGNLIVNELRPVEIVEQLGNEIFHVHATDAVRDLARRRGLEVALGRGVADYPAILGALEERDYRGDITIQRLQSDDPVYEIGQAVRWLKSM